MLLFGCDRWMRWREILCDLWVRSSAISARDPLRSLREILRDLGAVRS